MKKYKLYNVSADGGRTWSAQWLTPEEAETQKTRHGWHVHDGCVAWDTNKIMCQILTRYDQLREEQNHSNARDFLEEIHAEITRLLEVIQ